IYFPMGLDGGRHRFRLNADGSLEFRANDHYLKGRPGQDTPRLALEKGPVRFDFQVVSKAARVPSHRSLEEGCLPICETVWEEEGLQARQTALVTLLSGASANGPVPPSDA
ncbi:MAG: hypothetical protein NTW03_17715, partial [Verrucomicrobia bacterium]|nr:hypothetical protein [Verrucomicrobiota bacterium]